MDFFNGQLGLLALCLAGGGWGEDEGIDRRSGRDVFGHFSQTVFSESAFFQTSFQGCREERPLPDRGSSLFGENASEKVSSGLLSPPECWPIIKRRA